MSTPCDPLADLLGRYRPQGQAEAADVERVRALVASVMTTSGVARAWVNAGTAATAKGWPSAAEGFPGRAAGR